MKMSVGFLALVAMTLLFGSADVEGRALELTYEVMANYLNKQNVFLCFYMPLCPACKGISKQWNEFADKIHATRNDVKIMSLNVDLFEGFSKGYNIRTVPQFMLFRKSDYDIHVNYTKEERTIEAWTEWLDEELKRPLEDYDTGLDIDLKEDL